MHRALHTDLAALETVCTHYRTAHGDAFIAAQRRVIAALLGTVHESLHKNHNKTLTILDLTQRLTLVQWDLFLMRGWRRGTTQTRQLTIEEALQANPQESSIID